MEKNISFLLVISITAVSLAGLVAILICSCQTEPTGFACEIFGFATGDINAENGNGADDSYEEALAKCLTVKGIRIYYSSRCGYSNAQKERFGEAFELLDSIDCLKSNACSTAGITGYPTWVDVRGNKYPSSMQLEDLAELFGC